MNINSHSVQSAVLTVILLSHCCLSWAASSRLPSNSNPASNSLVSILNDFQDVLNRLKEYANNAHSVQQQPHTPKEESHVEKPERSHVDQRFEDDDPYPEFSPELDRYAKDLEDFSDDDVKQEKKKTSVDDSAASEYSGDISLKDALMYLANLGRQLKQEKNDREKPRAQNSH